jgi:hypothetical protein
MMYLHTARQPKVAGLFQLKLYDRTNNVTDPTTCPDNRIQVNEGRRVGIARWPDNQQRPIPAYLRPSKHGCRENTQRIEKQKNQSASMEDNRIDYSSDAYMRYFFDEQVRLGFTAQHWHSLVGLHKAGAHYLKHELGCDTCFEFGSGLGFFLIGSQMAGLDTTGYDINPYVRDFAISQGVDPDKYILGDFHIASKADACYCIETFEHMTDDELRSILPQIAENCTYFYFTSTPYPTTPEKDAEWGHINLKQKEGWKAFFATFGLNFVQDVQHITSWGMLFKSEKNNHAND